MRISTGLTVNVQAVAQSTERWLAEIRAGRAFYRGGSRGASVGNFSEVQLLNPAGSGVNVNVFRALISTDVAGTVGFRRHDTALGTLDGTGFNLLEGAAASVSEIRTANPGAQSGTERFRIAIPAAEFRLVIEQWLVELGPGEGVLFSKNTVNQEMQGVFFWMENAV